LTGVDVDFLHGPALGDAWVAGVIEEPLAITGEVLIVIEIVVPGIMGQLADFRRRGCGHDSSLNCEGAEKNNTGVKVHFPLLGFNLSGGVRVIIRLANGLVKLGHDVRITVPAYRAEPPFPLDPSVDLAALGSLRSSRLAYRRLLIREAACWGDVLVATGFKTPSMLRRSISRNRSNARLLYLIQGYEPVTHGDYSPGPWWIRRLRREIALRSYPYADRRVYVSRFVAKKVGLDSDPLIVSPGIDQALFHPGGRQENVPMVIGAFAHSTPFKGLSCFLTAIREVSDLGLKVRLLQIGELPNGLPPEVEVHTAANDAEVASFYRGIDLFVFPSLFEGFGLPPLEAMASGTAVVASRCGGLEEYARDGENCLLFPPGDSRALAEAIRRMASDQELRNRLRRHGFEKAAEFPWEQTIQRFEQALQS
jgi:glycosyltransferase involved in cell wall biosynthesis